MILKFTELIILQSYKLLKNNSNCFKCVTNINFKMQLKWCEPKFELCQNNNNNSNNNNNNNSATLFSLLFSLLFVVSSSQDDASEQNNKFDKLAACNINCAFLPRQITQVANRQYIRYRNCNKVHLATNSIRRPTSILRSKSHISMT